MHETTPRTCARRADGSLLHVRANAGRHRKANRTLCLCHGHCADCGGPVVMDKLGRFVHASEYGKRRR